MIKLIVSLVFILALLVGQTVAAQIEVRFIESAPKDRFVIKNTGECELQNLVVEIDLSASSGRLIFDTTATGAGVEVFQPFEALEDGVKLISSAAVADGDTGLSLGIESLLPGQAVNFTIDVDDTLPASELGKTRVAGAEINGGIVRFRLREQKAVTGTFGLDSKALAVLPPCPH